jgi:hypothetical protein
MARVAVLLFIGGLMLAVAVGVNAVAHLSRDAELLLFLIVPAVFIISAIIGFIRHRRA